MKSSFLFALILSVICVNIAQAQDDISWEFMAKLPAGYAVGMEYHDALGSVALSSSGNASYSTDSGRTWKTLPSTMFQASGMSADAFDHGLLYAATNKGVLASSDGKDWDPIGIIENDVTSIDVATGQNYILAGTTKGAFLTRDRGQVWEEMNDGLPSKNIKCVGASRNQYHYAGIEQGLFKHDVMDFDWFATTVKNEEITSIRTSLYGNGAWAGSTTGLYYSDQFESEWVRQLTTSSPVTCIWDPAPCVLAGTTNGLYYSSDEGQSWKLASGEIAMPDVTAMMTSMDHHILLATRDGSIYKSKEVVGSTLEVKSVANDQGYSVYPNPASDRVTISFPAGHEVDRIAIIDALGREVFSVEQQNGVDQTNVPIATLPNGVYQVILQTQEADILKTLIVRR